MLDEKLPTEILSAILQHLPPTSHIDFACTCKKLAAASQYILRCHRDNHARFGVASDQDPATVSYLLESAFEIRDPVGAWHVRSFELWHDRIEGKNWVSADYSEPSKIRADHERPVSHVPSGLATEFKEWFEDYVEKELRENYHDGFEQARCGNDGLLKAMLLAKCPRLQEVKFITRSLDCGSCLYWLQQLIFDCVHAQECRQEQIEEEKWQSAFVWVPDHASDDSDEGDKLVGDSCCEQMDTERLEQAGSLYAPTSSIMTYVWPVGFSSVRRVAVGVNSDLGLQFTRSKDSTALFACILRLPNLETIYFNGLRCIGPSDDEEDDDYEADGSESDSAAKYIIPAHSSSVKHIFLDGLDQSGDSKFYRAFSRAPRELITFALRSQGPAEALVYSDSIVDALSEFQGHSLESLVWYGYDDGTAEGYECSGCLVGNLAGLLRLKQVSFNIRDLALSVESAVCRTETGSNPEVDWDTWDKDDFIASYIANAFPESMETLVLWGKTDNYFLVDERYSLLLERAFIKMIKNGRYQNLKAIFLQQPEPVTPAQEGARFQTAVTEGAAVGVDVNVSIEGRPVMHSIKFPEPVEEYHLGTRLGTRQYSEGWSFDPFVGKWRLCEV